MKRISRKMVTAYPPAGFGVISKPQGTVMITRIDCWPCSNLREGFKNLGGFAPLR